MICKIIRLFWFLTLIRMKTVRIIKPSRFTNTSVDDCDSYTFDSLYGYIQIRILKLRRVESVPF